MQYLDFQIITEKCLDLIKNINVSIIQNIYSEFDFLFLPNKIICQKEKESLITTFLIDFLKKYKFITYFYSKLPDNIDFLKSVNQNNEKSTSNLIDVVICVEKKCLIIEKVDKQMIEKILNGTKSILIDSNSKKENDFLYNFYSILKEKSIKNSFYMFSFKPIFCYSIRRYFYPSNYFNDKSFFTYDQSYNSDDSIECSIENDFIQLFQNFNENHTNEFQTKILTKIKSFDSDTQDNLHIQQFKNSDFILINQIYKDNDIIYYLAIHVGSLYLFAIEKIINYDGCHNFEREIKFCKKYSHRCFTRCYGFIKENDEIIGLVYEYMCNGELLSYNESISEIYSFYALTRIFEGIEFLHKNSLIHRDIKPSNILIDHDFIPYISDFETIKDISNEEQNGSFDSFLTKDFYSNFYGSPEIFYCNQNISYPTDIFSFGMVVYFLFEKKNTLINILDDVKIGNIPKIKNASNNIKFIYNSCVKYNAKDRIELKKIKEIIIEEIDSFSYFEDILVDKNFNGITSEIIFYLYENIYFFKNNLQKLDLYLKNVVKFYKLYLLRSKKDYSTFLLHLGNLYFEGDDFEIDYSKSKKYYELSAQLNNLKSCNNLGFLYEHGIYVKQDYKQALNFYEKASKQNYSIALVNLGNLYLSGDKSIRNISKAISYFEKAGEQNESNALFNLGIMYFSGDGVKKNYDKSIKYFERSSNDIILSYFILGYIYIVYSFERHDYYTYQSIKYFDLYFEKKSKNLMNSKQYIIFEDSLKSNYFNQEDYFNLLIQSLDIDYFCCLGEYYQNGEYGLNKDYIKAKFYYEFARKYGNLASLSHLGVLYLEGLGVKQNIEEAKKFFILSAQCNDSYGIYYLGYLYFAGKGFEQNYEVARKFYEKSANLENSDALYMLGIIYEFGYGVEINLKIAGNFYEKAANLDNKEAYYHLGCLYFVGKGVEQNFSIARMYFTRAAELKDSNAILNLAVIYLYGLDCKVDQLKAKKYFEKLANEGNPIAIYNLGNIYENGLGVPKDLLKAKYLYEKGAKLNNSNSIYRLSCLFLNGIGIKQNYEKAIEYLNLSAQQNNPMALYELGLIYFFGVYGVEKDVNKGIEYIKRAADENNSDAFIILGLEYLNGENVKKDIIKSLNYFDLAVKNNNSFGFIFLGDLYSSGEFFEPDWFKSIMYYVNCDKIKQEFINNNIGINVISEQFFVKNRNYYRSINNLSLLLLIDSKDPKLASQYMKKAALNEFPFSQNSYGLFLQFYEKNSINAKYFFEKSAKQNFFLAMYNLGHLYEEEGNIDKSIEIYNQALKQENIELKYNGIAYGDRRLRISIIFVKCFIMLKMIDFYFSNNYDYDKIKQFFVDCISELVDKSENYGFICKYTNDGKQSIFSYIKSFILEFPSFNLKNQTNNNVEYQINLEVKTAPKNEQNDDESKMKSNTKLESINHLFKNKEEFVKLNEINKNDFIYVGKSNLRDDEEFIFEDPSSLFDFIIKDDKKVKLFIRCIKDVIKIMNDILYIQPYSILFGRININKTSHKNKNDESNLLQKNIDKSFYEGFEF